MLPVIRHWLWLDHVLVITNMLWLWSCCIAGWIPKLKVWSCCTAGWIPKLKEETHSDGLGAWIKRDPPVCWSMGNKLRYWHRFSSTRHSNRPNNSCVTFSLTDQVGTHTHTRAHAHTHSLTHTHTHTHICMHTLVLTYMYTHTHHVPCLWHLLNTQGEGLILQIVRPVTFPWSTDTRPCPSPCYSLLGRCGLWTRHRWWWCSGNRRSGSLAPNTQKHRLKKNAC